VNSHKLKFVQVLPQKHAETTIHRPVNLKISRGIKFKNMNLELETLGIQGSMDI